MKLSGANRVEFEIYLAILAAGLLNTVVFATLSGNRNAFNSDFSKGLDFEIGVYIIYALVSILCIFFKKLKLLKMSFFALLAYMTWHIVYNLYSLIINPVIQDNGSLILADAMIIWCISILVFSLWYWIVDRGGPVSRAKDDYETRYDLLFPQYQGQIKGWDNWHPKFLDYVFFSFFTSTGFSPADTLPLTKRVKTLMMVEAFIALIIIGMVASRALSLIQS